MADFYVKNGLFDRKRLLRLQPETIEFEVNDTKDNLFIKCRKEEVKAFKYYDARLQFDMFRVGLSLKKYYTYCLQLIFLYFCHYNKWHSACTI